MMTTGIFILLFLSPCHSVTADNPQILFSPLQQYNTGAVLTLLDDFDNDPKKDDDAWFAMDKFWHFAMAFALSGSTYHLVCNQLQTDDPAAAIISVSSTLGFSVLKEFYDLATYGLFSYKDLTYDILGISAGYFVFMMPW